ncbi:MAG: hypothetical protein E7066_07185 [Lentimicrobiaceae bacterium]|nr:hypothetical protein [Lentimicrobiaceae bacterium]
MILKDIAKLLNAKVICGESRLDEDYNSVFASDLMSDILTLEEYNPLIVTGLCTIQTIRTCEMGNLSVIIFVRKKKASPEIIELAEDNDMVLMECDYSMFKACGILYQNGLSPLY